MPLNLGESSCNNKQHAPFDQVTDIMLPSMFVGLLHQQTQSKEKWIRCNVGAQNNIANIRCTHTRVAACSATHTPVHHGRSATPPVHDMHTLRHKTAPGTHHAQAGTIARLAGTAYANLKTVTKHAAAAQPTCTARTHRPACPITSAARVKTGRLQHQVPLHVAHTTATSHTRLPCSAQAEAKGVGAKLTAAAARRCRGPIRRMT